MNPQPQQIHLKQGAPPRNNEDIPHQECLPWDLCEQANQCQMEFEAAEQNLQRVKEELAASQAETVRRRKQWEKKRMAAETAMALAQQRIDEWQKAMNSALHDFENQKQKEATSQLDYERERQKTAQLLEAVERLRDSKPADAKDRCAPSGPIQPIQMAVQMQHQMLNSRYCGYDNHGHLRKS